MATAWLQILGFHPWAPRSLAHAMGLPHTRGICRKFTVIHLPGGGVDSPCIAPDCADLSVHVNVDLAAQMQAATVTHRPED